jgi:energy-coupling factor transporter transmembrane protein EcfT
MVSESLANALGFNQSELEINQSGYLSTGQRDKLWMANIRLILFAIPMEFIAGGLLFVSVRDVIVQGKITGSNLVSILGFGLVAVVLCAFLVYRFYSITIDLRHGTVDSILGPISLGFLDSKTIRYKVQIENIELEIPEKAYKLLTRGDTYEIYYTPRSKTLLSLEKPVSLAAIDS